MASKYLTLVFNFILLKGLAEPDPHVRLNTDTNQKAQAVRGQRASMSRLLTFEDAFISISQSPPM